MAKKEEYIRDGQFRIIGIVETLDNGDQVFMNWNRKILGYYKKQPDYTTDFFHKLVARGNAGVGLILEDAHKK